MILIRKPAPGEPQKPAIGGPCNGCGICCMAGLCPLATHVFRRPASPGPCPALERLPDKPGYGCGLLLHPEKYAPARAVSKGRAALSRAAGILIASGEGCDAPTLEEEAGAAYQAHHRAYVERMAQPANVAAVKRASLAWGVHGSRQDPE